MPIYIIFIGTDVYIIKEETKRTLCIQLYEELKKDIIKNYNIGEKIPSIRKIASTYNLSKNTVEKAFSQLVVEGYIDSYPKSGYVVTDTNYKNFNDDTSITIENEQNNENFIYDFHPARLDKDSFPLKIWKRIFNKAIDESLDFGKYSASQGEYGLRNEIAKYLIESRGVRCNASQVIVCNGFADSMGLVIRLLSKNHDTLAIEHPGYHVARKVFESNNYKINKIPLTKNGIDLEKLKDSNSKLVYITPSHQYPTGISIPISNRLKLLDWAKDYDALIIEDDYDSELTYENRPIPALQGLDSFNRVIYVGTFSKSLSPAIRVSYLVIPQFLIKDFNDTFESRVSLFTQKTLEKFMSEGHWDRHLRKIRTLNKKKHNLMKKKLEEKLGSSMKIENQGGGLAIHINPNVAFDWDKLKKLAIKNKIKLHYAKDRTGGEWQALMMGFGGLREEEIEDSVDSFSKIWFECIL